MKRVELFSRRPRFSTPPEPTEAELRAAWLERRRCDWPQTFEAVMAHPLYAPLVRLHAVHRPPLFRSTAIVPPEPPPGDAAAPMPHARPGPTARPARQAALFDRKRLAAGEREDEE